MKADPVLLFELGERPEHRVVIQRRSKDMTAIPLSGQKSLDEDVQRIGCIISKDDMFGGFGGQECSRILRVPALCSPPPDYRLFFLTQRPAWQGIAKLLPALPVVSASWSRRYLSI